MGNVPEFRTAETVSATVARLTLIFTGAGIDSAQLDARLLTAAALGCPPEHLRRDPEATLDAPGLARLDRMAHRRARGREPVSRILGHREFWSLDFALSPATLDPRPDSETLVATALDHLPDVSRAYRLLDLGTGTGCLLLAVLWERPGATGIGADIDPAAVATAAANAEALGLAGRAQFRVADWTNGLSGRYDVILSNPPYIPRREIAGLAPEVARHDHRRALDGGVDGLDAYRALARRIGPLLADGGVAILEIGADQAATAAAILERANLKVEAPVRDLAGRDRCLVCRAE